MRGDSGDDAAAHRPCHRWQARFSIAELRRLWFGPERDPPITVERQGKPIELFVHLR